MFNYRVYIFVLLITGSCNPPAEPGLPEQVNFIDVRVIPNTIRGDTLADGRIIEQVTLYDTISIPVKLIRVKHGNSGFAYVRESPFVEDTVFADTYYDSVKKVIYPINHRKK